MAFHVMRSLTSLSWIVGTGTACLVACGGNTESDPTPAVPTGSVPTSTSTAPTSSVQSTLPKLPRSIDLKQVRFSKVVAGKLGYFCGIESTSNPGSSTEPAPQPNPAQGRLLCVEGSMLVEEKQGPYIDVSFNRDVAIWDYQCAIRETRALECESKSGLALQVPTGRFLEVAVSFFNACALDEQGKMHCWTSGLSGGTPPLEGQFQNLAVAMDHVCASVQGIPVHGECRGRAGTSQRLIDSALLDVAVWSKGGCGAGLSPRGLICWEDGSTTESLIAEVDLVELSMNLSGEGCGLSSTGEPVCWVGRDVWVPSQAKGPLHGVSVGSGHTCALDSENRVQCWSGR